MYKYTLQYGKYISIHKQYISILIRGRNVHCNMVNIYNIYISIQYMSIHKNVLNRGRNMHAYNSQYNLTLYQYTRIDTNIFV